jgi:uncharacterized membrane protein (Fun14 family)
MTFEAVIPIATSIGGGFFIGILLGYFIKKIIKILMFITGGILGLLLYLQQQGIISLNIEKLEASSSSIVTWVSSLFDKIPQIGDVTSLGIPITASMIAGFTIALLKG